MLIGEMNMAFEFNGIEYATNDNGHLENHEDWSDLVTSLQGAKPGATYAVPQKPQFSCGACEA